MNAIGKPTVTIRMSMPVTTLKVTNGRAGTRLIGTTMRFITSQISSARPNGQQEDPLADRDLSVVSFGSADGISELLPEGVGRLCRLGGNRYVNVGFFLH
jgi:hypothetical protein